MAKQKLEAKVFKMCWNHFMEAEGTAEEVQAELIEAVKSALAVADQQAMNDKLPRYELKAVSAK